MNEEESLINKMQSVILLLNKIAYMMCKDYCKYFDNNLNLGELVECIDEHCKDCPMRYIS